MRRSDELRQEIEPPQAGTSARRRRHPGTGPAGLHSVARKFLGSVPGEELPSPHYRSRQVGNFLSDKKNDGREFTGGDRMTSYWGRFATEPCGVESGSRALLA